MYSMCQISTSNQLTLSEVIQEIHKVYSKNWRR